MTDDDPHPAEYEGVLRDGFVDFGCPHCNALGDEFCTDPDGRSRKDHQARIRARLSLRLGGSDD